MPQAEDKQRDRRPPLSAIFLGIAAAKRLAKDGEGRPLAAMKHAEALRNRGASESQIWRETNRLLESSPYAGVSYGADGKARFEVSDGGSVLRNSGLDRHGRGSAADFLRHPELYRALPEAAHLDVRKGGVRGHGGYDGRTIYIGDQHFAPNMLLGRPRARDTAMGVFLHEVQHYAQDAEGRPAGGTPDDFKRIAPGDSPAARAVRVGLYKTIAGEVEAEVARHRRGMTSAERRATHPDETARANGLAPRSEQIVMDSQGRFQMMADPSSVKITKLETGAAVQFSYDKEMVARFKGQFPKARWSAQTKTWHIPGKLAGNRADKWLAIEQDLATKYARAEQIARDAAAFDKPVTSKYVTSSSHGYSISTPYDPKIVAAIKSVPGAQFTASKTWIVPYQSGDALKGVLPEIESRANAIRDAEKAQRDRWAAEKEAERKRWAAERAAQQAKAAEHRATRFPVHPSEVVRVGDVVRDAGKVRVVTGFGKDFRADDGFPSIYGSKWLGYENDRTRYAYTREATAAEAAGLVARETAEKAAAERAAALGKSFRTAKAAIDAKFAMPKRRLSALPAGETLAHIGKQSAIYGGGTEYRLSADGKTIWRIRGNSADGDNWSASNAPQSIVSKTRATKDAIAKLRAIGEIETKGLRGTQNPANLQAILDARAKGKKAPAPAEAPPRLIEMAEDIKDFGQKIGGARKDRAVKTGPRSAAARAASAEARAANAAPQSNMPQTGTHYINIRGVTTEYRADAKGDPFKFKSRTFQNVGYGDDGYPKSAIVNANTYEEYETKLAAAQKAMKDGEAAAAKVRAANEAKMAPSGTVRQSGKRFEVFGADGKPVLDAKGKPKWFGSREKAEGFLAKGQTAAPTTAAKPAPRAAVAGDNGAPDLAKLEKAAAKLEAVAKRTIADAQAIHDQPRLMNTARRARMGSGVMADQQQRIADAKTALKIAEALRRGEAGALSSVKSLADVRALREMARDAEYATDRKLNRGYKPGGYGLKPEDVANLGRAEGYVRMDVRDVEKYRAALAGKAGFADALRTLERYASNTSGPDGRASYATSDQKVMDAVRKVATAVSKDPKASKYDKWDANRALESVRNFDRAVGVAGADAASRQNALRAFLDVRESKATPSAAQVAERNLIGMKLPGFFPTPEVLARRMADIAGIEAGHAVLEPSAGSGRLADAAKARGAKVDAVETASTLRDILTKKGHNLIDRDFTSMKAEPKYDRILMNPPFEKGQDMAHVQRAYEMLKPGGKMVAVMGEGGFFRSDKQSTEFRGWLDRVGGASEKLPEGTFKESNTGVNTRLVTISKPAATGQPAGWSDAARLASAQARGVAAPGEAKPAVPTATPPAATPHPAIEAAKANDVRALAKALATNTTRAGEVLKAYKKGKVTEAHLAKMAPKAAPSSAASPVERALETSQKRMVEMAAPSAPATAATAEGAMAKVNRLNHKLGAVAMVAAPAAAAALAFDATRNAAHAAGADAKTANVKAGTAAAVAGGTTAAVGYGIMKGIGLLAKGAMKVAPVVGGAAVRYGLPGVGLGLAGYGAAKGYKEHGWKGAVLGAVGAESILEMPSLKAPAQQASPKGGQMSAVQAEAFRAANEAYAGMQAAKAGEPGVYEGGRGWANPKIQEAAQRAKGNKYDAR